MDPANIKTIQDMMGQFLAGMEELKKLNPGSSDPANKPLTCLQEAFSLFQSMVMKELAQVKQRMDSMEDRQDRAEQYSRRNCLLFIGLEEGSRDDESACLDLVMDVIKNKLSLELSDHVVERCHRLGPKKQGRRRPIIVKFYSYRYRREVFSAKKSLAGTGVVITEFLTQNRMVVYSKAKEIHGPKNVWTSDGKIMIKVNDRKIVVSSVQQIPGPNPVASQTVNTDRSRTKKTTGTVSDSKTPKKPITRSNSKLMIDPEDKAYLLTLEVDVPIDNFLIQCDVPLDLLDVDKNTAVLSLSECDPQYGNAVLATYRCQANTTRLEFKFRAQEGLGGLLQAYVTPHILPKCCQLKKYQLKPLCLHVRTHRVLDENKTYNVVDIRGDFSLYEIHSWVTQCLQDIPDKPPASDIVVYRFESALLSTILQVQYSKGFISLTSDSVSAVSIMQDFITRSATKKKSKFEIQQQYQASTVLSTLQLVHPLLQEHIELDAKYELLLALLDIRTSDAEGDVLIPEFKQILSEEKEIKQKHKKENNLFKYLCYAVVNLFLDWNKHRGLHVKSKLPHLESVLNSNYSFEKVVEMFDL